MMKKPIFGDNRREEDMINQLPDSLVCEILVNLPTKDVVRTSLVCSRWRNLWKLVPALDLEINVSEDSSSEYRLLDRFIDLNSDLCLKRVKLRYVRFRYTTRNSEAINSVIKQRIQNLDVGTDTTMRDKVKIPPTIYTSCESLVSLKLCGALMPTTPKSVSLPRLKIMDLRHIKFVNCLDMERLISGCPALETLTMGFMYGGRVLSQSLLSFCLTTDDVVYPKIKVVMETPRLKYLHVDSQYIDRIIINDLSSIVKLNLNAMNLFYDEAILTLISCVRDLICHGITLSEVNQKFLKSETVPQFDKLSTLSIKGMMNKSWEHLKIFLEITPNLISLFMGLEGHCSYGYYFRDLPQCVLSSLEFVEVKARRLVNMMKMWRYFIENSSVLKRFTLRLDNHIKEEDHVILKELFKLPRRSKTCEVVIWSRPFGTNKPWSLYSCAEKV